MLCVLHGALLRRWFVRSCGSCSDGQLVSLCLLIHFSSGRCVISQSQGGLVNLRRALHGHSGTGITDLVGWAPTVGIAIPAEARTPDYVMWNPTTGDFALMEAKGTMGATHTSQMARALHQCPFVTAFVVETITKHAASISVANAK
jgi:hypothetical protein